MRQRQAERGRAQRTDHDTKNTDSVTGADTYTKVATSTADDFNSYYVLRSGVAYTFSESSAWWNTVTNSYADASSKTAGTTFTANNLTFTKTSSGTWTVEATSSFNAATFAAILKTALDNKTVTSPIAADTVTAENTSVTLNVGNDAAGYYLVDTTLGVLVALDTSSKEVNM